MEYRVLPHGGEKIGVIGLGAGSLSGTEEEMADLLDAAVQGGINYFDIAPSAKWRNARRCTGTRSVWALASPS